MELSEADQNRIRAEEIFRTEVRRTLDEERSASKRFVSFFQTAFGLWLLSAVFLSIGGWLANRSFQSYTDVVQRRDEIDRLDTEIAYRLSEILVKLEDLAENAQGIGKKNKLDVYQDYYEFDELLEKAGPEGYSALDAKRADILTTMQRIPGPTAPPLYPEYAKFTLLGLCARLRTLMVAEGDEPHVAGIDAIMKRITTRNLESSLLLSSGYTTAKTLETFYMLDRWRLASPCRPGDDGPAPSDARASRER